MRDDGGSVFLICRCLREKQTILFHLYSAIPHPTWTGVWRGGRWDQSPALPERSRTDIMESDSLLASLSADGEIQAVTWLLASQQKACSSWTTPTLVRTKLPNWLTYPTTLNKNNWWTPSSHYSASQVDPFVSLWNDHPNTASNSECQTHWLQVLLSLLNIKTAIFFTVLNSALCHYPQRFDSKEVAWQ